jgi:hypothetical protein
MCQLERHKLSIKRLKNMFGFSTERRGKHNQKEPKNPPAAPNNSSDNNESSDTKETPEVNPSKKPLSAWPNSRKAVTFAVVYLSNSSKAFGFFF